MEVRKIGGVSKNYRTIEPKTWRERLNISKYESDLEGILTSVPNPFQVRFKSVPIYRRYNPHRTEKKKRISLGETDTQNETNNRLG